MKSEPKQRRLLPSNCSYLTVLNSKQENIEIEQ